MLASSIAFEHSAHYDEALDRAAAECGIDREYYDIFGHRHEVSTDVRRRLLAALGLDVSSLEAVEEERLRLFQRKAAFAFPNTVVIGESDKAAPLSLPHSAEGALCFEIRLEDGGALSGTLDVSSLPVLREMVHGDQRWLTYRLPLPAETPLGYHRLKATLNGQSLGETSLTVCPDRAYLPEYLEKGGRAAGFNVTLYGLRSQRNWGCGDFTDLKGLIDWAGRDAGFSFIGLNPLHALHNRIPYNQSPYLPLSIFYKNFIYIDVEDVPEWRESACARRIFDTPKIQDKIRTLRDAEFVAYQDVAALKKQFLKLLFRQFERGDKSSARHRGFAQYCDREASLLHRFALYCALDEVLHKQNRNWWTWRDWPQEYQSPHTDACRQFAEQHSRLIRFYQYVQFVIDQQLSRTQDYAKESGMPIGLYHDLALATDRCGSDLWAYREFYVNGCRVGAPPDDFSPNGQDWAFPPPNTCAHHDNAYELYRESIRKIVAHGGALRIDHVMRLIRLFWIPDGADPAQGIYVRDNAEDLLHILALESVRNANIIVGEDLGTVTDEMRDMFARFRILSYRLFYFERYRDGNLKGSHEYPHQALVSSSTHDLPTLAGFWRGRDIEARRAAGLADESSYRAQWEDRNRDKQRMLDRVHAEGLLPHWYARETKHVPDVDGELHNAIVGFLAQVPSMLLLLNQEDFTKETEQQNLPGSTAEYPNWQRKMKIAIEDLRSPALESYAAMFRDQLQRTGRTPAPARA
jgi:4-alpha-glucanotransferase